MCVYEGGSVFLSTPKNSLSVYDVHKKNVQVNDVNE